MESSPSGDSANGQGGSMARFTLMGDYMYIVDNTTLKTIRLDDPAHPKHLAYKDTEPAGWNWNMGNIETIYPDLDRNLLFIGSQTAMYIYDASNPELLTKRGEASHIRSCDPVVSYGDYAYVTLNNSNNRTCWSDQNVLKIYDISYLDSKEYGQPRELRNIQLATPQGLGVDEVRERLFVCAHGLLMYDITDPVNPTLVDDLQNSVGEVVPGIVDSYDVIAMEDKGYLLLVGKDGVFQLNYGNDRFELLDYILVNRER
jgi:hypothetical protein